MMYVDLSDLTWQNQGIERSLPLPLFSLVDRLIRFTRSWQEQGGGVFSVSAERSQQLYRSISNRIHVAREIRTRFAIARAINACNPRPLTPAEKT